MDLSQGQGEGHVLIYSHMRIQSIVLENHCNVTILRLDIVHDFVTDLQCTIGNFLKACNHTKCCGFTAA